jgi:prophage regulatory protein
MKLPIKILRMAQTEEKTGLGRTQIGELVKQDLFPNPVPLTKRTSGFIESEVENWLEGRKSLRDLNNPQLLAHDRILNADLTRATAA